MIRKAWLATSAGGFAGALALATPDFGALRELANWLVRPAVLPFAWSALEVATRGGNANEAFARGQQILAMLPSWIDGHAVFAYQFVLDGDDQSAPASERAAAADRRLQIGLAWLEAARAHAGRREAELLGTMALLPEVAAGNTPGLAELLGPGGHAAIADHYLSEAERCGAGPAVRENRTFRAVEFAGALLRAGDRDGALRVFDAAIARCADVRDRALATVWQTRLEEVRRHLRGAAVDLAAVRADARMAPLLPYLR